MSFIRERVPDFLTTPYDDCTLFQSQSTELVVFSASAGEYVVIAWPLYHGRRILPHRIRDWLRNRGLHWACFCSLTFGGSRSTRIVDARSGNVYALCNDPSSVCGFRMNLSQAYETATYESEYSHLPSLSTGTPDMDSLRRLFRPTDSTRRGPYFRGYCGEHVSEYSGINQLAGFSPTESFFLSDFEGARPRNRDRLNEEAQRLRATIARSRPASSAYTRIRGRRNVTAAQSTTQTHNVEGPLTGEQEIIDRLQAGEGVLGTEMTDLFGKCTLCNHYFVASLLRLHIRTCAPDC